MKDCFYLAFELAKAVLADLMTTTSAVLKEGALVDVDPQSSRLQAHEDCLEVADAPIVILLRDDYVVNDELRALQAMQDGVNLALPKR